jgi:hypothetical protein
MVVVRVPEFLTTFAARILGGRIAVVETEFIDGPSIGVVVQAGAEDSLEQPDWGEKAEGESADAELRVELEGDPFG